MKKYIYKLPYSITGVSHKEKQLEIFTQKSSFIIEKSPLFNLVEEILNSAHGKCAQDVCKEFSDKIAESGFYQIIDFMKSHDLIYLSDRELNPGEINLLEFLSQYTISLKKYLDKMKNITFRIYSYGENLGFIAESLECFGLNYEMMDIEDINDLNSSNIILVSMNAKDKNKLDEISNKIEKKEGLLWCFALYYDDSFKISPILNQINYTDYRSLQKQLNLDILAQKTISRNKLVQNMAVCEMLLQILTSIMKLNIQTSYNKTVTYDSLEKTLFVDRIYYYPDYSKSKDKISAIQRWDGEV